MSRPALAALVVMAACSGSSAPPVPAPVAGLGPGSAGSGASAGSSSSSSSASASAVPLDRDLPRLIGRALDQLHAVAAALDTEDCAAAAAHLTDIGRTYADVIAANAIATRTGSGALAAALAPRQPELDAAAGAVFGARAMHACAGQPAFDAALDAALGNTAAGSAAGSAVGSAAP